MKLQLPPLPYPKDALEPYISARTLEFHYEKHHRGYLQKLQKAITGTADAEKDLASLIASTTDPKIFNLAAQVWNHSFYWDSLSPDGGGEPSKNLSAILKEHFGSVDEFKEQFTTAANAQFGSGWAWLIQLDDGSLVVKASLNAENPLSDGFKPLLTLDVWEHAYYLDYQHARDRYVDTFLQKLINWKFIEHNLEKMAEYKAA